MAGVVQDEFWLLANAQQTPSRSSNFDAKMEKTLQQKRQSDGEWFEEFKREEAEWRRERRKKPRKEGKGSGNIVHLLCLDLKTINGLLV